MSSHKHVLSNLRHVDKAKRQYPKTDTYMGVCIGPDSSVSKATRLWARRLRSHGSIPGMSKRYLSSVGLTQSYTVGTEDEAAGA
jgi:hypothetical protein